MKIHKYHSCENTFLVIEFQENIKYDIISVKLCKKYVDMVVKELEPLC